MKDLESIKEELFDLAIERQRDEYRGELESFDDYKARMKRQSLDEWDVYFARLAHGYETIIAMISSRSSSV